MAVSQKVLETIQAFKSLNLDETENQDIYNLFSQFGDFGVMETRIAPGTLIARTRCETSFADVFYEKDISCRSNPADVGYGRANSPGYPTFYGTVLLDGPDKTALSRSVCVAEVSKIANDKNILEGSEYAYTGFWLVEKEIIAASFISDEGFKQAHEAVKKLRSEHLEYLARQEGTEDLSAIFDFIAEEFRKEVPKEHPAFYKITSTLAGALLGHDMGEGSEGYDAVVYSSVKADGNGINIAITPEAVRECMTLQSVFVERLIKDRTHIVAQNFLKCYDFHEDGKFIWKEDAVHSAGIIRHYLRQQNDADIEKGD